MAWESLKAAVEAVITTNANNEITGQVLRELLTDNVISQLGLAEYKGFAIPSTNPGTPEFDVFYLAYTAGTYSNFSGIAIKEGEIAVIDNKSGGWVKTLLNDTAKKLRDDYSDLKFQTRKNKFIAYDPSDKKLKVIGSDAVQPTDTVALTIKFEGVSYVIKASVGDEFTLSSLVSGHSQIGILTTVADPANVSLSDFVVYNDQNAHANFIKLAHIVFNDGLASSVIKDYRNFYPSVRNKFDAIDLTTAGLTRKGIFNGDFLLRMNKFLTYDPATSKLKIIGSNAAAPTDTQVFNLKYDGVQYTFKGEPGDERQLSGVTANTQLYIPKTVADPTNVTLSDLVMFVDSTDRSDTHIKLAHITYNDGITSNIVKDYRNFYPLVRNYIDSIDTRFVFNAVIRHRKRKWIAYDRETAKLIVVGSDAANATDELCLTLTIAGISYLIKDFVGVEVATGITSGNSQIYLSKSVADPANVHLSDFEFFNDSIDRTSTHIKLAHITYNDAIDSEVIIDYQDYVTKQQSQLPYLASSSFINNSIGESSFANGVRSELKILAFGNSYMRNSCHYLSQIAANGVGVNLTVGNLYTGGTRLDDHYNAMVNETNPYEWHKYENGVNTVNQTSQTAKRGLQDERWDVVILHQYRPWEDPFEPYLNLVIAKIIEILGYTPKFYLNATWATHEDYVLAQTGFNTELEHWTYEVAANEQACIDSGIIKSSIIPTGTAIQNARTLSYADDYFRFTNSGGDWHHLNCAGGFIAACTLYEKIIYPLNGIHCSDTTFRILVAEQLPPGNVPVETNVIVTNDNYLDLCQSAIDAVATPDAVTSQV